MTSSNEPPPCSRNSDCRLGEVCKDSACVAGCSSERDCPEGLVCDPASQQCQFPVMDAGPLPDASTPRRDASVPPRPDASIPMPDAGELPLAGEEETCDPIANNCKDGLTCFNFAAPIGPVCLNACTPPGDGGIHPGSCDELRQCWELNDGSGACLRTLLRDESCITVDPETFMWSVDELALCEPGTIRLTDNPDMPFSCACKKDCQLANCPGPNCECPDGEECIAGVVTSATLGMCGTAIPPGGMCDAPYDYPFSSSQYCDIPDGVPPQVAPLPYCFYKDFIDFEGMCYLICEYSDPNSGTVLRGCPPGTLCLPGDPEIWGDGIKVCGTLGTPDAGMMMGTSSSSSGASSSSAAAGSSSAAVSSSSAGGSSSEMTGSSSQAAPSSSAASPSSSAAPVSSSEMPASSSQAAPSSSAAESSSEMTASSSSAAMSSSEGSSSSQ